MVVGRRLLLGMAAVHRHPGIGFMTPAALHRGRAPQLFEARQVVLTQAFAEHPERFRRRLPMPPALPTQVGINLPTQRHAPKGSASVRQ